MFTLLLLLVCSTTAWNQCRGESVVRIRPKTKLLPITHAGDFRYQKIETEPLVLLTARIRKPRNSNHIRLQLTVENITSQSIRVVEYGVGSCPDVLRGTSTLIDNGSLPIIGPKRRATLLAPNDKELEALLDVARRTACKPLMILYFVEFKDGSCWRPNVEVNIDENIN